LGFLVKTPLGKQKPGGGGFAVWGCGGRGPTGGGAPTPKTQPHKTGVFNTPRSSPVAKKKKKKKKEKKKHPGGGNFTRQKNKIERGRNPGESNQQRNKKKKRKKRYIAQPARPRCITKTCGGKKKREGGKIGPPPPQTNKTQKKNKTPRVVGDEIRGKLLAVFW